MLRVYCDSNIFRYVKPSHPSHNAALKKTMDEWKDKLVFCFSDAHIDDLKDSKQEYHEEDLGVIEGYTANNYFTWERVGQKQFKCYLATPAEVYANTDFEAYQNVMENPFDLTKILSGFEDSPETQKAKEILNGWLNLPITALAPAIDTTIMDERTKERFNSMLPGYSPISTIGEMMKGMGAFANKFLHDKTELTELRKYIRDYMDSDGYNYEKWGRDFNEQFSKSGAKTTFLETVENTLTDRQKDDVELRFSYAYSMLEVFNVTDEKQGGKRKKFNFGSLHTDGQHALYGSFCDYLVTDDNGLQMKAHILYELFGIQTRVMSSASFIEHARIFAGQEETLPNLLPCIEYDLTNGNVIQENDIESGGWYKIVTTTHAYFNYFNRLKYSVEDGQYVLTLYCKRFTYYNLFMYREIQLLIHKMLICFGPDDQQKESGKLQKVMRQLMKKPCVNGQ